MSLADYIGVSPSKHATYVPHTAGRYSVKRFRKAQCPIVERLTKSLMMHGRNNGKKLMAVRIIKHAMEIIHLLTDLNPIQVIVDAVINRYVRVLRTSFFCVDPLTLANQRRVRVTFLNTYVGRRAAPNVVSKKETVSRAPVFMKLHLCHMHFFMHSSIPPMIDVGVLIRIGFCFTLVKHGNKSNWKKVLSCQD